MDEKKLVERSKSGDEEAFEELVKQSRKSVYFHCLRIVKDEEIAEDLTQETFLHAYQHLDQFKMKSRFSTWLWRICHNLCLNYLKKKTPFEMQLKEEITPTIPLHEENPEFLKRIQEILETLPEKNRIVFEMYDLKHIPQKEIAEELHIPHGTVRSRLYYARKKIKEKLGRDFLKEL